ncbi:hypothetical protein GCM10019993_21120 [Enterococcus pseudoavium]
MFLKKSPLNKRAFDGAYFLFSEMVIFFSESKNSEVTAAKSFLGNLIDKHHEFSYFCVRQLQKEGA